MSDRKSKTIRSKKKRKKKFLLTSRKCWLIDEKLIPLYQHLVDGYSGQLREEWTVKCEESNFETTQHVKEEPLDDYFVEHSNQVQNSTNQFKVIIQLSFCPYSRGGFLPKRIYY